jgi:hypothetical protein
MTAPDHLPFDIDDKPLKEIIGSLYYPDYPYEFSVLPADILGQVYEQFLGRVIRLTPSHQAKVEEKPEVIKAGGVYYTTSYIAGEPRWEAARRRRARSFDKRSGPHSMFLTMKARVYALGCDPIKGEVCE